MSILDRLNLLIRSNISDASSSSSRSGWRSTMRDMETSLRDARRQLAELRVNERKLVGQVRAERERADQWEDRAMLALRNTEEDLAREALTMKNRVMREVERLHEQLDEHRAYMRDIESSLEALEMKLDGTRGRMSAERTASSPGRSSQGERGERDWDAEMRKRMQGNAPEARGGGRRDSGRAESFERFDTEPTFREFDRMSHKISGMEAEIDAIRELSDDDLMDPRKRELDDIFNKMESKRRVDDDLSDLKRKFSDD